MDNVNDLGEEIATLSAHMDAAAHHLLACIRRFDQALGWQEKGFVSCAHWLSFRVGWDPATAREWLRVARALGSLPAIDEALRTAQLSYAKVRALTRVATSANEARLLDMALLATASQLERLCRGYRGVLDGKEPPRLEDRSVRSRLLPGGMVKIELVLVPDEADLVLRAVERARQVQAQEMKVQEKAPEAPAEPGAPAEPIAAASPEVTPGELDVSAETPWPTRADGAVKVAEAFLAGHPVTGTGGERFQVVVHLDQEVLGPDGDWAATLEDGSRVSAETFRRVACDCGLVAARRDGEALNIGRRTRTIPPAIRRALMLRDHGCAFPGCTHTAFLHGHHVEHWLHGGETSLSNLLLLCTRHHHLVHEGGWTVTTDSDGSFTFQSPAGALLTPVPSREPVESRADWLRQWAYRRRLNLGPEVNLPQWDGKHPDYNAAVGVLLDAGS